jgi:hypothetical protein
MLNNNHAEQSSIPVLQVNNQPIVLTHADGKWWVAIKPICTALNVNYDRQFKNIKEDKLLSQLYAIQHTTGADGKRYEMLCLPEKFIYGWLFSINSESEELQNFKLQCYEVLYEHFHGVLANRQHALKEKTLQERKIVELQQRIKQLPEYEELQTLLQAKKAVTATLNSLDANYVSTQLQFWNFE